MIDEATVSDALADVRAIVAADGGDLTLDGIDGETARLQLVLEGAECRECVMPRHFLEQVALDMMKDKVPGLAAVAIDDPREQE